MNNIELGFILISTGCALYLIFKFFYVFISKGYWKYFLISWIFLSLIITGHGVETVEFWVIFIGMYAESYPRLYKMVKDDLEKLDNEKGNWS